VINAIPVFTVSCPSCLTEFPVDAAKVPGEGVYAVCSVCLRVFRVERPPEEASAEGREAPTSAEPAVEAPVAPGAEPRVEEAEPVATPPEAAFEDLSSFTAEVMAEEEDDDGGAAVSRSSLSLGADRFGKRDPHERARRLARVLVSDVLVYYPAKFQESSSRGTVKEDFQDEVRKCWKEYVDQVGLELAESTPYFEEALNEILGKGERVF
jgi:predicted Zn finger-like uncharacterized protein